MARRRGTAHLQDRHRSTIRLAAVSAVLGREDVKKLRRWSGWRCSFPLTGNSERMRAATVRAAEVLPKSPLFSPERNDGAAFEARAAPKGRLKVSTAPQQRRNGCIAAVGSVILCRAGTAQFRNPWITSCSPGAHRPKLFSRSRASAPGNQSSRPFGARPLLNRSAQPSQSAPPS